MKKSLLTMILASACCLAFGCSDDSGPNNSNSDGTAGKKDGGGSSGTLGPMCLRSCKTVDNCCAKPPCDKGMASYSCEKGYCKYIGCKSDSDCFSGTVKVGTCEKSTAGGYSVGTCGLWCTKDSECSSPLKCVMPIKNYGKKMCGFACKKDADCLSATLKCVNNSYCATKTSTPDKCTKDSQCPSIAGLSKCNTTSGQCTCESDQKCQDALKAAGGTYKCVKWPY